MTKYGTLKYEKKIIMKTSGLLGLEHWHEFCVKIKKKIQK